MMQQQGYIIMQQQGYTLPDFLEMLSLDNDPELPPLPPNNDPPPRGIVNSCTSPTHPKYFVIEFCNQRLSIPMSLDQEERKRNHILAMPKM
jgi:hypothetical protein